MSAPSSAHAGSTTIPARLDRLPWSRWHWRVVIALGACLALLAGACALRWAVDAERRMLEDVA